MKLLLKTVPLILLMGILIYASCKKDQLCENCGINLPGNTNKPPIANAGPDQTIILPKDSVTLDGGLSVDHDGSINSFQWIKISGSLTFSIVNVTSAKTLVKNLLAGVYQFELRVTDNRGLTSKDTVIIIVTDPGQINRPPVAHAGADHTVIRPSNITDLNGSGSTDPDNNIISYLWSKIAGPTSYTITNAGLAQTRATNLELGVYRFELKVTDTEGFFSKDTVEVTVKESCGKLVSIGTLSIPREYVCAATAGNKILFAGGATQFSPTVIGSSRVDIYDMVSQSWTTAELSMPRLALVAVTQGNKIYFTDGFYNGASRVDIYDASSNTWSIAELRTARAGLASCASGNKIVFAGGYDPFGDKIDILDVSANNWSSGTLNEARADMSVTSLGNKIYFSGGLINSAGGVSNSVDIYDAVSSSWSGITMTEPRWGHVSIAANNKIFWAGGGSYFDANGDITNNNTVEIYDVNSNSRSFHPLSITPFNGAVINNKIVFLPVLEYYSRGLTFNVELYDINTKVWSVCTIATPGPVGIGWRQSIIGAGNKIYMSEGLGGNNLSKVWKLEF